MTTRKEFLQQAGAASASLILTGLPGVGRLKPKAPSNGKIWAYMLPLSYNRWEAYKAPGHLHRSYSPVLRTEDNVWNDMLNTMAQQGLNMGVIALGNAIKYKSHPEIAVRGAWNTQKLRKELAKMRGMGIEPIPHLNFSTAHDAWLTKYSRMVSTKKYYQVCSDLIAETIDLFDGPRFFHLGMDEENANPNSDYRYQVIRKGKRWWGDFYFLVGKVEDNGSRAWIWSDYVWHHPDLFYRNMPKSVVQSNWYYGKEFNLSHMQGRAKTYVKAYVDLAKRGYDQIPTGSGYSNDINMKRTVQFCSDHIAGSHLYGFMNAPWEGAPTKKNQKALLHSIKLIGNAKQWYVKNEK